jgi:hypothetical protein
VRARDIHIEEEPMTTAGEIRDEALSLARSGVEMDEGVTALLARADRRVPVVMAKRLLEEQPSDPLATQALKFVEGALERGGWAE